MPGSASCGPADRTRCPKWIAPPADHVTQNEALDHPERLEAKENEGAQGGCTGGPRKSWHHRISKQPIGEISYIKEQAHRRIACKVRCTCCWSIIRRNGRKRASGRCGGVHRTSRLNSLAVQILPGSSPRISSDVDNQSQGGTRATPRRHPASPSCRSRLPALKIAQPPPNMAAPDSRKPISQ